ncbi:hypothetical protein ACQEU8_22120 [Streptomyces sp. CA-250714]
MWDDGGKAAALACGAVGCGESVGLFSVHGAPGVIVPYRAAWRSGALA